MTWLIIGYVVGFIIFSILFSWWFRDIACDAEIWSMVIFWPFAVVFMIISAIVIVPFEIGKWIYLRNK